MIRRLEKKNLAVEALRKLINGQIQSKTRTNVVQTRSFTERLEAAIMKYHNNALTTAQVIEELIALAKELKAARERGEAEGMNGDEIAFYDALAENKSAIDLMGNDQLKVISHELLTAVKSSVSIDWNKREAARARMRVLVKRILRRYGYPPDLADDAVRTVLEQAEALSSAWC